MIQTPLLLKKEAMKGQINELYYTPVTVTCSTDNR